MNLQFEHKLDNLWNPNSIGVEQITNWTSNLVPGAGGDLLIPAGMSVVQVGQEQHFNTDDVAHTLTVANGASLSSQSKLTIGGDFINAGATTISSNPGFSVAGTVSNDGVLTIDAVFFSQLNLTTGLHRIIGGGQIVMTSSNFNGFNPAISGSGPGTILSYASNILGWGVIGGLQTGYGNGGTLLIHNDATGVIDGTHSDGFTLILDSGAGTNADADSLINDGILRSSRSNGLHISHTNVKNTGTIDGNGGTVFLQGSVIYGGTITTELGGAVAADSSGGGATANVLDGSTTYGAVHNKGLVLSAMMGLKGLIDNSGTILENKGGQFTSLLSDVTLTGGGTLSVLRGEYFADITGYNTTTAVTLHNVDNTINGAGTIGSRGEFSEQTYRLALDNQTGGTVDGNNATLALVLQMQDGITNAGSLVAHGAGGLQIINTIVTQSAAHGLIGAFGATAHVDLMNATVFGGSIASQFGVVQTMGSIASVLDGSTAAGQVVLASLFTVNANAPLVLKGQIRNTYAITDSGTIQVAGT